MSEGQVTGDQQQSSGQTGGDQAAHLDSLIAQFQADGETDVFEAVSTSGTDETTTTVAEAESEIEPETEAESHNNSFGMVVGGGIAIIVIGIAIWQASNGEAEQQLAISQSVAEPAQTEALPTVPDSKQASPAAAEDEIAASRPAAAASPAQIQPPASPASQGPANSTDPVVATDAEPQQVHVEQQLHAVAAPHSQKTTAWAVNLTSVSTRTLADEIRRELESRGIASQLKRVIIGKKMFYRVRIAGFSTKAEAERARLPFLKERSFGSAWLEKYRLAE